VYVNSKNDTLKYLFLKPLDYDSTQKYPLVTCLHGGPKRVAGNVEVAQPAQLLSEHANRKRYPAFVFVPQAPPGVLWGGLPQIPSLESLVLEAMNALEKEFSIDSTRRYITGGSGGGYGTWHFISMHPDMFAAAMPLCGAGNPELASRVTHIPVWAFHGDADRNVPVTGSRNMIEAIKKAGGEPKYNEFAGVGHNVWPEVEKTEGVIDWLFAQRKNASHEDTKSTK
jgi:predicted peptidase